jgi:hypothetical protein
MSYGACAGLNAGEKRCLISAMAFLRACSHSSKSGRHGATCNMVMKVMDAMTDGDRHPSSFMVSTPAAIISGVMIV